MQVNKIAEPGIYCISRADEEFSISTNTYIIVDEHEGQKEVVLIDPGSVQGFDDLKEFLHDFLKQGELSYIVLQHQDPDLCAATPALEKVYPDVQIATHWRSAVLVKHYGIVSPFYLVDQNQYRLQLKNGRELLFFHTPYAHSPAAIMTYDVASKTLFSGDLFGSFAVNVEDINENYFETIALFHENYIPSKQIMNLMVAKTKSIQSELGLALIAPQHGERIMGEHIQRVFDTLTDLECGGYLVEIEKKLISQEQAITNIVDELISMQMGVFGKNKWNKQLFAHGVLADDLQTVKRQQYTMEGIDQLLDITFNEGGHVVLDSFKNRIIRMSQSYDLPVPKIFLSDEYSKGVTQIAEYINLIGYLSNEITSLQDSNYNLNMSMEEIKNRINYDSLTGLYNQSYFHTFLEMAVEKVKNGDLNEMCLATISIDNMMVINDRHGEKYGNRIISKIAAIIKEYIEESNLVFKYLGAQYMLIIPEAGLQEGITILEGIRNHIYNQSIVGEKISVSIGISHVGNPEKAKGGAETPTIMLEKKQLLQEVLEKLKVAKRLGGNRLVTKLEIKDHRMGTTILVADANQITRRVLRNNLEDAGYRVIDVDNGHAAIELLEKESIQLIVSEILLPRKDGYAVLDVVKKNSELKDIPMVFITSIDYDEEVVQALDMGAADYMTKPFSPKVVVAKIRKLLKR